jgi:hypothetical protein
MGKRRRDEKHEMQQRAAEGEDEGELEDGDDFVHLTCLCHGFGLAEQRRPQRWQQRQSTRVWHGLRPALVVWFPAVLSAAALR